MIQPRQGMLQSLAGYLERQKHGVAATELLLQPVNVANIQMNFHVIRPINSHAIAELEFDHTRKGSLRVINELQQ